MGLVSTWLTGIGLSSAVPTFHAAGITTPSALAELDVNHFEALGISDPNDRRKLFYLVQRIKMVVNKEKPTSKGESVEEKVEALISSTIRTFEDDEAEDPMPVDESNTNTPRRSKRLKKKDKDTPKKEKKDKDSKTEKSKKEKKKSSKDKSSDAENSPTKKKKKKTKSSKEDINIDNETAHEEKKEEPAATITPRKVIVGAAKANAVFNLDDFDDDTQEPQHSFVATPTRTRRAVATPPRPPMAGNTQGASSVPSSPANLSTPVRKANSPTAADRFVPKSGAVTPTASGSPPRNAMPQSNPNSSPRHQPGISPPRSRPPTSNGIPKKTPQSNLQPPTATTAKPTATKSAIPTPTMSRLQAPKLRRPESKLQNPGTSARTGKRLGPIPSATQANTSPLKPLPFQTLNENIEKPSSFKKGVASSAARPQPRSFSRKDSKVSLGKRMTGLL